MNKKESGYKKLFLIAAIYDLLLGLIFFLFYNQIYSIFNIQSTDYPMYLQLSAAFVIAMGVGYYFVYKNLYRNVDLVKLGIVYKIVYSGLTIYFFIFGPAHYLFLIFAIIDIIFIAYFVKFLMFAKEDKRYLKWK
jgi:hypothetical protein